MSAANQTNVRIPTSRIFGLVAIIAATIGALVAIDTFLENAQRTELQNQAQKAYVDGSLLLQEGKAEQAVDALRKAHSLARLNVEYQLGLIQGLMAAGKIDEAEPLMNELLQREPNDGRANLIAARLSSEKGRMVEAESYYHRAIYGEWPTDADAHQMAARMELIDFLIANGKQTELLAELLPLEEKAGKDLNVEKQLAHLFLVADSPSRAADVYRSLIRHDPKDPAAFAGLGEAELERGDYHAAHVAFNEASRRKPADGSIRAQLQLSSTLTALDPTPRRLPSIEKYRRSVRVLELAYDDLQQCITNHPSTATDETRQLLTAAEGALRSKPPAHVTNEEAEGVLGLGEKVWQARIKSCGTGAAPDEEPIRLMMEKLAQ